MYIVSASGIDVLRSFLSFGVNCIRHGLYLFVGDVAKAEIDVQCKSTPEPRSYYDYNQMCNSKVRGL